MKNTNGSTGETVSAQDCFNRGNTFYDQKDYQSAISEYNDAIRLNPDFAEAYSRRGASIGQRSEAISDFDTAIRDFAEAEIGQRSEAISDFDTAIRLNPELSQKPIATEVF